MERIPSLDLGTDSPVSTASFTTQDPLRRRQSHGATTEELRLSSIEASKTRRGPIKSLESADCSD